MLAPLQLVWLLLLRPPTEAQASIDEIQASKDEAIRQADAATRATVQAADARIEHAEQQAREAIDQARTEAAERISAADSPEPVTTAAPLRRECVRRGLDPIPPPNRKDETML